MNFRLIKSLASGWLMMVTIIALSSCRHVAFGAESDVEATVDSFACDYFNWYFEEAARHCTPESERWLRYAASNVHQADIDLLTHQEESAQHEILEINMDENDTTATAHLTVRNYLHMDTIGTKGHFVNQADFVLNLVRRNGRWLVRMGGLPRSGKRNRDRS